jgi:hypothetical protein
LYITASAAISGHQVLVNKELVFEGKESETAPHFLESAYANGQFNYPKFYKMDHLSKLGWVAAEYLLKSDAQTMERLKQLAPESVCILLMNASSSLDTDLRYYTTVAQMASPSLFVYTLPNIVMGEICIRNGFKGENMFLVRDAFDAEALHLHVQLMMSQPGNEACICGWVEYLHDQYKSVLFLVENNRAAQSVTFTPENIKTIYPR